ncbi:MFS transporter [Aquibium sp. ELW1220]|uniref:MFS transporter n=1 Tax=Aquibium sp. ELW1220 TaxID=2976766 RepID=UPI0025B0EE5C|nr:MFS transporter [Aquibium sp. ELW1220]MDN2579974.1 MFS transporter [Aquibium sp. ELW1220]
MHDDRMKQAIRGRWAVAAVFLVNGFLIGSWAPQIPVTRDRLEISEFSLGLLILGFGLGALVAMPACGYLIGRIGSRSTVKLFGLASTFGLLVVALAPGIWAAAAALVLLGALIGGTDVAMNANAVEVEKQMRRAIMSSSHGFWSVGGFIGGGAGGAVIQATDHRVHAAIVTAIALGAMLVAVRFMVTEPRPEAQVPHRFALPRNPIVYLVGLIALFSMIPEGAVLDWAAIYLREERGSDLATAGLGFAAFSATMALMRFVGDKVRNRFGAVRTLRVSSLVAAAGMLVAGFAVEPWIAIAAFGFAGLGIANMVPIAFSAAGNQPGTSSGASLSTVTLMGYSGILVAPSAIGFVGERFGFAPVYVAVSVLLVVVCLMAGLARAAEFEAAAESGRPAQ